MRNVARSLVVAAAVAAVAIACGSGPDSEFVDPNANGEDGAGGVTPPPGSFVPTDAGNSDGPSGCKPLSCTAANANCGPIGDGCGGSIPSCGTCGVGDTCGGGGKPSQCGRPPCIKKTCADLGANCGAAGDGCGGLIASCGTCDAGICGGGGPSKCGGGGDAAACVPTKVACAATDCGPIADGCGAILNCPAACPAGQTCGGGGSPSVCGAPPCVKKTCGTQNCGFIADGCGGSLSCWPAAAVCPPGMTCGGANVPNTCGTPAGCTGLCLQQQTCAGGGTTSIEGYVTSPNGLLPVPNAVVYVPNGAVAAFTTNVQCETCATASGSPLVSTTTDANGHFLLPNMPVSTPGKVVDIPVVVQLGRWRKQLTISTVACKNNLVPSVGAAAANKTAALPTSQAEGDIPLTAISTGNVDGLECVFRKMGVADSEFTDPSGIGRIRLYQDNGAIISLPTYACTKVGSCDSAGRRDTVCKNNGGVCTLTKAGTPAASTLYGVQTELDKYDAVIFGCVGSEQLKATADLTRLLSYANKGGRVFATHFSYVWLNSPTTWGATADKWAPSTASWNSLAAPGSLSAIVDTSFAKGVLFATWLQAPVAPTSATFAPPYAAVNGLYATVPPTLALTEPRKDIDPQAAHAATSGIVSPAQRWIYSTNDNGNACAAAGACKSGVCTAGKCVGSVTFDPANDPAPLDAPMHYTFNTDTTKPAAQQCGRVLYSDFHVSVGSTGGKVFPAECDANALTSQEKVLAYMLFDLASCVASSAPPACKAKTCLEQGLGCGLAGDGCGGQLDCGLCPAGQTCGGGGVPSQCGAPACAPKTCADLALGCGLAGDGCGGPLNCGPCVKPGDVCGGAGPNNCGGAACVPLACPAPAQGSSCGPVANGCGAVNNCPCPANLPCVNGTCGAPPCVPRSCAEAGANCGTVADGCGGTLACGNCIAPQTCGGGNTPNLCGGGVN